MSRAQAIAGVEAYFDDGRFMETMQKRVAIRTESQEPASRPILYDYLNQEMAPYLQGLGFTCEVVENPLPGGSPFLIAERLEEAAAFTLLTYGHGDVVRGYDQQWRAGLSPWEIVVDGDRWYGRGTADNKAQHTINLAALEEVIKARGGKLGYNVKVILEMGEETGSPGLNAVCQAYAGRLKADVFIASDGPRVNAPTPTMFLGSRGGCNFDLTVNLRDGGHHSGNWGGLLRNPGVRLANAIACLVDGRGRIRVPSLLPESLPQSVRNALAEVKVGGGPSDPEVDAEWGEPGMTPAERVFGWNTLEVLAFKTGNPEAPVNAIPGRASAHCQIRFVVGSDDRNFIANIRAHLDAHGYDDVAVTLSGVQFAATRLDPDDEWVRWGLASMQETSGKKPTLLPNLGGSLPNDVFSETLGLPTLWVPHSYPACSQHAPNEHILASVSRESLQVMAGLFWDLAEQGRQVMARRAVA
ncbi:MULTISPECIES: M20 family metallopeptidase [unclassified Herbaspirillum]|uniref:M20 family metallopeptidase n=1 Tax=unclassified Herbaspirillum TaxID=2624150 RepID=UPI001150E2F8|nr:MULTISPECIES: M20 family metallopeptidase [unclassified Herbaspirillum]MBB5392021.1 acetylornithine deacetylase/succinyl-diaminopimelate desuccinylase-like protein [Herbaspirillum sp. SJZ102]TQK13481.1 acetylornithine deacetylase/succinyl-diaminopimelate desuccinylase-like protein [Herbaspirillum sp. SJZ130]TQK15484.1 acetylornithine deacetylase/succinyl-diaminopimelate desuccinylase-like protein [Herbaspirillum sp. SJZ106]TWC71381.1 acetylornithine deacetylase/succinyl-diaminopimelate desuc